MKQKLQFKRKSVNLYYYCYWCNNFDFFLKIYEELYLTFYHNKKKHRSRYNKKKHNKWIQERFLIDFQWNTIFKPYLIFFFSPQELNMGNMGNLHIKEAWIWCIDTCPPCQRHSQMIVEMAYFYSYFYYY